VRDRRLRGKKQLKKGGPDPVIQSQPLNGILALQSSRANKVNAILELAGIG
jgi:hypothetical protein